MKTTGPCSQLPADAIGVSLTARGARLLPKPVPHQVPTALQWAVSRTPDHCYSSHASPPGGPRWQLTGRVPFSPQGSSVSRPLPFPDSLVLRLAPQLRPLEPPQPLPLCLALPRSLLSPATPASKRSLGSSSLLASGLLVSPGHGQHCWAQGPPLPPALAAWGSPPVPSLPRSQQPEERPGPVPLSLHRPGQSSLLSVARPFTFPPHRPELPPRGQAPPARRPPEGAPLALGEEEVPAAWSRGSSSKVHWQGQEQGHKAHGVSRGRARTHRGIPSIKDVWESGSLLTGDWPEPLPWTLPEEGAESLKPM